MASEELRLAAAYNALGLVCKDLGRFDEARSAYARALAEIDKSPTAQPQAAAAIYHNLGGSRHPDFAAALNNLAVVCRRRGIPGQAESLYLEALDVLREVAPYGHPRATSIRRNLERCAGPREGNSNVLRESELEIHEP